MNFLKPLCLFILVVCFTACATNKLQVDQSKLSEKKRPNLSISHTMYSIGDAGFLETISIQTECLLKKKKKTE